MSQVFENFTRPTPTIYILGKQDSVQSSRSVVSDSLQSHGPQHTRLPCPSPTPGVHSNSMDMNLSKLWETMKEREVWHAVVYEVAKSQT